MEDRSSLFGQVPISIRNLKEVGCSEKSSNRPDDEESTPKIEQNKRVLQKANGSSK